MTLTKKDLEAINNLLQPFKNEIVEKVDKLDETVDKMKKKVDGIENYIKRESDYYEYQCTDALLKELQSIYFSSSDIKVLNLRRVVQENGQELTDLDGAIVVKHRRTSNTKMNDKELSKKLQTLKLSRNSFIGGDVSINDFLFIMECKHKFLKTDIDKKIRQMMMFDKLINIYKNTKMSSKKVSKTLVSYLKENEEEIKVLPIYVKRLYFGCPSITNDLIEYVTTLNDGLMTAEKYKNMTFDMYMKNNDNRKFIMNISGKPVQEYDDVVQLLSREEENQTPHSTTRMFSFTKEFFTSYDPKFTSWCWRRLGLIIENQVQIMEKGETLTIPSPNRDPDDQV